mmetsp:Transcript_22093/g.74327  ORF Transcript_22093/g.74327 Transcript_22093/m.74327 type:complete len:356 (-) Transcript_22093:900-1967(-)
MRSVVLPAQSSSDWFTCSGMVVTSLMAMATLRPIWVAMALDSPTTGLRRKRVSSRRRRSRRYWAMDASRALRRPSTDLIFSSSSRRRCSSRSTRSRSSALADARSLSSSEAISSRSAWNLASSSFAFSSRASFSFWISSSTLSDTVAPSASVSSRCAKSQSMTARGATPSARALAAATGSLKRRRLVDPMMMRALCSRAVSSLSSLPFTKVVPATFLRKYWPSRLVSVAWWPCTPMPLSTMSLESAAPRVRVSERSQYMSRPDMSGSSERFTREHVDRMSSAESSSRPTWRSASARSRSRSLVASSCCSQDMESMAIFFSLASSCSLARRMSSTRAMALAASMALRNLTAPEPLV